MGKVILQGVKADGSFVNLSANDDGLLKIIVCAVQADGTVTPVKCDADGQLVIAP